MQWCYMTASNTEEELKRVNCHKVICSLSLKIFSKRRRRTVICFNSSFELFLNPSCTSPPVTLLLQFPPTIFFPIGVFPSNLVIAITKSSISSSRSVTSHINESYCILLQLTTKRTKNIICLRHI